MTDISLEYIHRSQKFKDAAEKALNDKVLFGLDRLTLFAMNKSNAYAWNKEQEDKIITEIKNALTNLERAFAESGGHGRKHVEL